MPARAEFDRDRCLRLFTVMLRIRAFEEAALRAHRDGLVHGAIHASIGQEAVASGVCGNLRRADLLLSTHRGHGHTLAKGADAKAMMCELLGRAGGICDGKGGSMHVADMPIGMLGANGVVAANILLAAGAAHGIKLLGEARIVACLFGDGAVNRGPFLEGLNWAAVYRLPVLFVCEDNGFAAMTRTASVTAGPGIAARAESLGIPAVEVDGNDVVAVDEAASALVAAVRSGAGARLLVARTYRLGGHTGADPATYRDPVEVAEAWWREPIARCAARLREAGTPEVDLDARRRAAAAEIDAAAAAARAAPPPDPALAFADVQDLGAPSPRGEPWRS